VHQVVDSSEWQSVQLEPSSLSKGPQMYHTSLCSVSVRVRPLASCEKENAWRADESKIVPVAGLGSETAYNLDNVFDESWTTAQVSLHYCEAKQSDIW